MRKVGTFCSITIIVPNERMHVTQFDIFVFLCGTLDEAALIKQTEVYKDGNNLVRRLKECIYESLAGF